MRKGSFRARDNSHANHVGSESRLNGCLALNGMCVYSKLGSNGQFYTHNTVTLF